MTKRLLSRRMRGPAQVLLDLAAWWGSFSLATLLAPDGTDMASVLLVGASAGVLVAAWTFRIHGYSARWRVGEFRQVQAITGVGTGAGLLSIVTLVLLGVDGGALLGLAGSALGLAMSISVRGLWRQAVERSLSGAPSTGSPVIVYGAGDGGRRMIEALASNPHSELMPVAVLDDDPSLHGRQIGPVVVEGGRERLESVAADTGAGHLLLAIPSADRFLVRSIERQAVDCGLEVAVLPSVAEMVGRALQPDVIRPVTPADLLGRQPVDLKLEDRSGYLAGKTVLVTGAGGSIGSELCRQLSHLGPATLLMLDRDESALHQLQLSIDGEAQLRSETLIVADIREADRVDQIFERWKPEVVFHAAALKHLPLLELHPSEGVKTNVFGTLHLLDAAKRHGVDFFVNVSTDKAADPTSVLGWTKRIAERLTAAAGVGSHGQFVSVRFGNVLGSRGSVLTAFEAQIAAGGPVTVTHEDITRFFMTVEEASSLVIAAGGGGRTGDVLILEMGEPVKIVDVARELIERSGADVDIVFTGLRPGEKMHEVLRSTEEVIVETDDGLMWKGAVEPVAWGVVDELRVEPDEERLLETLARVCDSPAPTASGLDVLLSPPEVGDAERAAVLRSLDSGWIAPAGPELNAFDGEIASRTGTEAAVALTSGSAALELGLHVLGVKPGDEVVVQTATFAASAFAAVHLGAKPVFCDVDERTGMMDPELLRELLRTRAASGRLPAAVMPVDLYGYCADYDALSAVCAEFDVPIMQDAAESLGAVSQGRAAGSHGALGAVSFNGNKIITTSGGGALVGPASFIERARKLATQAKEPALHYQHNEIGFNYRMSNVLAAVGRAQLQDLDRRIRLRGEVRAAYQAALPELEWMPEGVTESPNNWLHVALLPEGVQPEAVVRTLGDKGIEARRYWKPMHLQPVFEGRDVVGGRVAESFFDRGLCLPSSQTLQPSTVERIHESLSVAVASGLAQPRSFS